MLLLILSRSDDCSKNVRHNLQKEVDTKMRLKIWFQQGESLTNVSSC